MSNNLRTDVLERFGLIEAIRSMVHAIQAKCDIQIQFHTKQISEEALKEKGIDFTLYRVVQESLANVAKHSKAKEVFVYLAERDGKIFLTVEDDGKGFDPDKILQGEDSSNTHLGLTIMCELTSLMGGEFEIDSSSGRGTRIIVEIPL